MADKSFLHRDLKLANIFLNDGRALLADFGFAKKHWYIPFDTATSLRKKNIT